jgi:NAD(P)-dependent dehydrogenase (short-subunit alcohol dehydrogenase family)
MGNDPGRPYPPVVLITGAARRLGRALALDFAARGWRVGVHHNASGEDAAAVVAQIERSGGVAAAFPADLADDRAVALLVPAVAARLGPVSCLINNASMFVYDDMANLSATRWDLHQAVNLKAPVFLAKALAEGLSPGASGNVVNLLDQRVLKPTPHFLSYAASKAGLHAMTRTLAQALAPRVRVNAIGPGPMLQSVHQSPDDFAAQTRATLLGRGTTPAEVAAAIRFILDAPALTGQMLALDGGQHLAWQTPDVGDGRG